MTGPARISAEEVARVFVVTFRAEPEVDAILAVRALLKRALRSHGLRCIGLRKVPMPETGWEACSAVGVNSLR